MTTVSTTVYNYICIVSRIDDIEDNSKLRRGIPGNGQRKLIFISTFYFQQ